MSDWPMVPLGDVATIVRQGVEPSNLVPGTAYVGLENIERGGAISGWRTIGEIAVASTKFRFTNKHILYGKLRPNLGKVARPWFAGVCSTDILPIAPSDRVDRDYLAHYLSQKRMVDFAASRATGANLPRLSPVELAKFEIPLPPLQEQRRIVAVLDQGMRLRAKRREALAHLDDLAQSIFLDMFDDRPITERPGWHFATVGETADVQGGLQVSSSRESNPMKVPYLRVANVHRNHLRLAEIKTLQVTRREVERTRLETRDLLLVEGHGNPAEIGRAALWDGSVATCVHQNHLIRARFDPSRVLPEFASAYINSKRGRQHLLRSGKTTSGLNTINVANVRATPLLVPPLSEQERYVECVEAIAGSRATVREQCDQFGSLLAALQSHAFSGRL